MSMLAVGLRHVFGVVRGAIMGEGIRGMVMWQSDWNEALAEGVEQHKGVLVEFLRETSPNCHELAKKCWSQMDIATAATDYVPVIVDIDEHPDLAKRYEIGTVPSLVVIDAKDQTIVRDGRDSIFSHDELLSWLKPGGERNRIWRFPRMLWIRGGIRLIRRRACILLGRSSFRGDSSGQKGKGDITN